MKLLNIPIPRAISYFRHCYCDYIFIFMHYRHYPMTTWTLECKQLLQNILHEYDKTLD